MKIKLAKHEKVIAVIPEYCSGPGWSNHVIWVKILVPSKWEGKNWTPETVRTECIQPEGFNTVMEALFPILESAHKEMLHQVERNFIERTE